MTIHQTITTFLRLYGSKSLFRVLLLLLTVILATSSLVEGQDGRIGLRTGVYMGTEGELPFWLYSNVNGKVDLSGTNVLNELFFRHSFWNDSAVSMSTGGNMVFRLSENNSLHFSELYVRGRASGLQLDAGRFRQPVGLNNHELSVGSMMVSHNATPLPKVSLSTLDYLDVPLTGGILQVKGMFSHGWFEADRYVKSPYLHQKYLYLRVNLGTIKGTGGVIHNAQWGGESPRHGRLPQSPADYLRVVTGLAAGKESGAPGGEVVNVIGNSVAAYEFGLGYEQDWYTILLTRLFYLEDKVSTRFRSLWDGVWGINFKLKDQNKWLSHFTYEHINTKNQDARNWELIGRRDYYDNFIYRSGWTYEGRTIGIPLILFNGSTISNNVVVGHHFGMKGNLTGNLTYRSLLTYSRNYGVRNDWIDRVEDSIPNDREDIIPREQFRKDQYSMLLELNYEVAHLEGFQFTTKLATDLGELNQNYLGVLVGVVFRKATF